MWHGMQNTPGVVQVSVVFWFCIWKTDVAVCVCCLCDEFYSFKKQQQKH